MLRSGETVGCARVRRDRDSGVCSAKEPLTASAPLLILSPGPQGTQWSPSGQMRVRPQPWSLNRCPLFQSNLQSTSGNFSEPGTPHPKRQPVKPASPAYPEEVTLGCFLLSQGQASSRHTQASATSLPSFLLSLCQIFLS